MLLHHASDVQCAGGSNEAAERQTGSPDRISLLFSSFQFEITPLATTSPWAVHERGYVLIPVGHESAVPERIEPDLAAEPPALWGTLGTVQRPS
jgi:hypothetical protein